MAKQDEINSKLVYTCDHNQLDKKERKFFTDVRAFIVDVGLGKTRSAILKKQLTSCGGQYHRSIQSDTTHIIVGKNMKAGRLCSILKIDTVPNGMPVVDADWLSQSLAKGQLIDDNKFKLYKDLTTTPTADVSTSLAPNFASNQTTRMNHLINPEDDESIIDKFPIITPSLRPDSSNNTTTSSSELSPEKVHFHEKEDSSSPMWLSVKRGRFRKRRKVDEENQITCGNDSDYVYSDADSDGPSDIDIVLSQLPEQYKRKPSRSWACAQSSNSPLKNRNVHITDILEILKRNYASLGDQWRTRGYMKAISSIKNYPREIKSLEEAESIPNVGKRLANKVWEIITCGHVKKLDYMDNKVQKALNTFNNVWGAGPPTAHNWIAQGFYTLDDVSNKAKLTYHQRIGIKYYDEFNERIPRDEVAEIEDVILKAVMAINKDVKLLTCGSYRRGKPTCGDVDILISHPDGRSHRGIYKKLIPMLQAKEFLTDILVSQDTHPDHQKLLGVCKLPESDAKHRRLDIIIVPYDEWACSLLYFTGSGHFNRSMRLLARNKKMHLSQHGISVGVVRHGTRKLHRGTLITTKTEKDVFDLLGLDYLEPADRDC